MDPARGMWCIHESVDNTNYFDVDDHSFYYSGIAVASAIEVRVGHREISR